MNNELLNKLAEQAAQLDDRALAAFASKGLLRRAQKDFEAADFAREQIALESIEQKQIKLRVADAVVAVTEKGLTQSICSCRSTEVCRHVLIACFWFAKQNESAENAVAETPRTVEIAAEPETGAPRATDENPEINKTVEPPPFQNLLDATLGELEKRAGKKVFAEGAEFLRKNENYRISDSSRDVKLVEFLDSSISVRLLNAADFAGYLCSCRASDVCKHRVAAVLTFRKEHAREFARSAIAEKAKSAVGLSAAQILILQKTRRLLGEFVEIGIAHLSASAAEQLQTLATGAGGASLYRLSFALKSLADNLRLSLERSARWDESAWLNSLAATFALASALLGAPHEPNPKFVGASRSNYEETGALELAGVGAYQWRTASGYHGVSILFWCERAARFFTWTDARPIADRTFSPLICFNGEMRWQGIATPAIAARSKFKLQNPQRNDQNRLSGSAIVRAVATGETEIEKLDFGALDVADWSDLRLYFAGVAAVGLKERESSKEFVVVRPASFGERFFDRTAQLFEWKIFDNNGRTINLKIPFNPINETAIQTLERIDLAKNRIEGILARLALDHKGLHLQPISLFVKPQEQFLAGLFKSRADGSTRILNLNLPANSTEKAQPELPKTKDSIDEIELDDENSFDNFSPKNAGAAKLLEIREILQNIADSGTNSISANQIEALSQTAKSSSAIGLSNLSAAAADFAAAPKNRFPFDLLKLVFLTHLHLELARL